MELRHIYGIASALRGYADSFAKDETELPVTNPLPASVQGLSLSDVEVNVKVSPSTHYGIDREFYRLTHNNSCDGFVHKDGAMSVTIDGVKFKIQIKTPSNDTPPQSTQSSPSSLEETSAR
ncbi:MAG: hypothetical protein LUD72_07430 [Bacteroidales bacterium]|nr:hypothetical protein [Bacteroidales bacterium]